uniref:Uncharacterized protein n=1 Tax=viral metagenome TaxID=1070528 RepID=A0A6M3LEN2_9ZZZZ
MNKERICQLQQLREDMRLAYIHEEQFALRESDLLAILDILDNIKELGTG